MDEKTQNSLIQLFETTFNEKVETFTNLAASGSDRRYARMTNEKRSIVGAYNINYPENKAFVVFTHHLLSKGIAVPNIYAEDLDHGIYLLEDLGDETLYQYLQRKRKGVKFPASALKIYRQVVRDLAYLQIKGHKGMDYKVCYQSKSFDKEAMIRDLNTFKYYFLTSNHCIH